MDAQPLLPNTKSMEEGYCLGSMSQLGGITQHYTNRNPGQLGRGGKDSQLIQPRKKNWGSYCSCMPIVVYRVPGEPTSRPSTSSPVSLFQAPAKQEIPPLPSCLREFEFCRLSDAVCTVAACQMRDWTSASVELQPCIDHSPLSPQSSADGKMMLITADK